MRILPVLAFTLAVLATTACKKSDDKPASDQPATAQPPPTGAVTPTALTPAADPPAAGSNPAPPPPLATAVVLSADTLQLAAVPNRVGDRRTKTEDISVIFALDVRGKQLDVLSTEHKQETVETLAIDADGARTKVRTSYRDLKSTQTINGESKDRPQPREGKTYLVWVEAGVLKATTADGAAVTADELTELTSANNELGRPDVMDQIIGGKAWKVGVTYTFTADDLARMNQRTAGTDKPAIRAMALTLDRFDATRAHFTLVSKLRQDQGKDGLDIEATGPLVLELPSGRALEVTMEGSLRGTANGLPSTGTMKQTSIYSY